MTGQRNLIPGQYQIGRLIFGKGTTVPVDTFDIKPYDINAQDYQLSRTDEMLFGTDQFKPTTIEITFNVRYNWILPKYAEQNILPNFWKEMPTVEDFSKEWRGDAIRKNWNQLVPLYYCGRDGIPKMVYGRTRQFTYAENRSETESIECLAQFQRADTLAYSATESAIELTHNADPELLTRTGGDLPAWCRVVGFGPLTNPVITVGEFQINLNRDFAIGETFEISGYPWQRRAVDDKRVNLATSDVMTGSKYLDRLILPWNQQIPLRWTADQVGTWVPELGSRSWAEDINDLWYWDIPSTFDQLNGRVVIGLDILNREPFSKYLTAGPGSVNCASVLYNKNQFNTSKQYSQVRLVNQFPGGRSAIVIMSDDDMTNYASLEVTSGLTNGKWLRIRTGTAPDSQSAVLAEWENTSLLPWLETDEIGFRADDDGAGNITFVGTFNGADVVSWDDSGHVVDNTNRRQGYIFDMDGLFITKGQGFRDLVSYDTGLVPADIGKVFLLWHDAWSTL